MPTYEYWCSKCEEGFERRLSLAAWETPQACERCGDVGARRVSAVGFVLKGDDWPGKNLKIQGQMKKKNEVLGRKQAEKQREAPGVKLVPNVEGERTSTWTEAQALAASKGKNAESYATHVAKEKASS